MWGGQEARSTVVGLCADLKICRHPTNAASRALGGVCLRVEALLVNTVKM